MSAALRTPTTLDQEGRSVILDQVNAAKARGWLPADLRAWFSRQGVEPGDATKGANGEPIAEASYHALVRISIVGIPPWPYEPNETAVRRHLEWLAEPLFGTRYDDALIEIAHDRPDDSSPDRARLFELGELDAAVEYALARNVERCNVYVGAAMRLPSAFRDRRSSGEDFYVATAVPADIDRDYDAVRARMAKVCEDGLVVATGLTPTRRSQHWVRLDEPCDSLEEFAEAFGGLVQHVGADAKVKDGARVMRLGGTISFPKSQRKVLAGYVTELTTVAANPEAHPSTAEALAALTPIETAHTAGEERRSYTPAGEIVRDQWGRVVDGRETYWRDLVFARIASFQAEYGADPTEEDVWEAAYPTFVDHAYVDNRDGRWTSERGQKDLRKRVRNTLRRLRAGKLKDLVSIETGDFRSPSGPAPGDRPRADEWRDPRADEQPEPGSKEEEAAASASAEPPAPDIFDPWDDYAVPDFPLEILPRSVQDFIGTQSVVAGCDSNGLAMAALANFSAALDHQFSVRMMRNGFWAASPRLWVLLVGDPSRKKTPIINAALRPLEAYQNELRDAYERELARHKASKGSEEDAPRPPPRYVVGDITVEKLGEILSRYDRGLLIKRDELSGWIGAMEKYGGTKASSADRAFWLQAFDGGPYTVDRVQRGEFRVGNLSVSLIGGIQPQRLAELHGLTSDGLLQRFVPIMLGPSSFPADQGSDRPFDTYRMLTRALVAARPSQLTMSDEAYDVSTELRRHLHELEQASGGLAQGFQAFVGKMAGLVGSLALVLHMIADPAQGNARQVSRKTLEDTGRLVRDFILPHAFEFYRTAEAVTDGDRLQKIASYILTSGKTRLVSSDLTRNVSGFQGLTLLDVNRRVSPLIAGGWLAPVEPGPVTRSWSVNGGVFEAFAVRSRLEEERKARIADLMNSPRKKRHGSPRSAVA